MATSSPMNTSNERIKYTITVTQNSRNLAGNTSSVTVSVRFYRTNTGFTTSGSGTVYCKINGTTYTANVTDSQKITNSGIVLFTKTLNIPHNADGTKILTCSAWITHYSFSASEQSYSQVLTAIPRKSTLSVGNGTLGVQQTLTVTRASTGFTHTITYKCGAYSGTIVSKSSQTSIPWTPQLAFANGAPNGSAVYVSFTITTYSDNTVVGSENKEIQCSIPSSVIPTVSISASDPTGYAAAYGGYVQSYSKVKVTITASGAYGSGIKSYRTLADGKTFTGSSVTTDAIKSSSSFTVETTVTDTRGRSSSTAKAPIAVIAYSSPKISNVVIKRCNASGVSTSNGAYLAVTFGASVTPLNNKNTAAYQIKYKKSSETAYTTVTLTDYAGDYSVTNGSYIFAADTASGYDVTLTVTDAFQTATVTGNGAPVSKLFSFLKKGLGIAFGKTAELENTVEFEFDAKFNKKVSFQGKTLFDLIYPIGSIYLSVNNVNPSTVFGGTWVRWGAGRVPVGVDTAQTEFNAVEKTGGSKTHTLTTPQIPSHQHPLRMRKGASGSGDSYPYATNYTGTAFIDADKDYYSVQNAGGGQPHNNLQPYITCYMWKRTA